MAKVNQHTNKTHCKRGHEFTPENTYIQTKGSRTCITCMENKKADLKVYHVEWHLNSHGWTSEMFSRVLKEQKGECAICPKTLTFEDKSNNRACADHEHTDPPRPRGILCNACNSALGMFQENIETMQAAIDYIKKFRSQEYGSNK